MGQNLAVRQEPGAEAHSECPTELLGRFKAAIGRVWANDGKNSWPVEINAVTHLFIEPFTEELLDDLRAARRTGRSELEVATHLGTAARIIRLIMPLVQGMKRLGLSIEDQRERVVDLLGLAARLKHGDVLSRGGRNLVLPPAAVRGIVSSPALREATPRETVIVHRLCGVLWAYGEALRLKAHGLGRQFHGPYAGSGGEPKSELDSRLGIDRELLVRDYFDLRPVELWGACERAPVETVRVVGIYRDLGLAVDVYDNPSISTGGTYREGLTHYLVEADGRALESAEIARISAELSDVLFAVTEEIDALDWRGAAAKYAEIFWASKRGLRTALGNDPAVPEAVFDEIAAGELNTAQERMSARDAQRLLRIAF